MKGNEYAASNIRTMAENIYAFATYADEVDRGELMERVEKVQRMVRNLAHYIETGVDREQAIRSEFNDLKSGIDGCTRKEVLDNWCTLGESDDELQLDVSCDGELVAVYVDFDAETHLACVSPFNVTIWNEDQTDTEQVDFE